MRSLSLLVLLIFAVVVRTVASSATATLVEELLANGAKWRFKSFNGLYLTDGDASNYFWALSRQDWLQDWTIEKISDTKVAIRSNRGYYLGHGTSDYARGAEVANAWEFLTPVKNSDGSWSFLSGWEKYLSGHTAYEPERYYVTFERLNNICEHWILEPYTPPAKTPLMEELLANGGHRRFKSFNGLYLTDEPASTYPWAQSKQDWGRLQQWTIVQMSEREVAIKSNRGKFLGHGTSDYAQQKQVATKWEMLTPVKNGDGSWSFKTREYMWLSAHKYHEPQRYYTTFESENKKCEQWFLEPYTPPAIPTLMEELLSNDGKRRFKTKANHGLYLTNDGEVGFFNGKSQFFVKPLKAGLQEFIIEQMNENEVAIRSRGYISHRNRDFAETRADPNAWEMLTPVKNADGSWSFKSRYDKWLGGAQINEYEQGITVNFYPENDWNVHWFLETY